MSVGLTVLQALASICSVAMILSSSPAMYRIHKRQDTGDVALFPLVGLWLNCHVLMLYGWATGDFFPLFATYVFGEVMAIVYIIVYIRWMTERSYAWKAIGASFLVVVGSAVYTILGVTGVTGQSFDQVGRITGYMMAVGSVTLYIAPFETIVLVLKTRSGASIPVGMCLAGAISNALWLVNGLLVSDMFILILSAVCSGLALLQVALFFIFHPSRHASGTETMQRQSITEDKYVLPKTTAFSTKSNDTAESSLASPVFIAIHSP